MMASGVRRSKHALPCAQHPTPMTISSTEGRYGIIEPWEHYRISTKGGGGVQPTPNDLENGGLYKLQPWQAIRTIYER